MAHLPYLHPALASYYTPTVGVVGVAGVVVRTGQEGQKIETKGAENRKAGRRPDAAQRGRGREERAEREE